MSFGVILDAMSDEADRDLDALPGERVASYALTGRRDTDYYGVFADVDERTAARDHRDRVRKPLTAWAFTGRFEEDPVRDRLADSAP